MRLSCADGLFYFPIRSFQACMAGPGRGAKRARASSTTRGPLGVPATRRAA